MKNWPGAMRTSFMAREFVISLLGEAAWFSAVPLLGETCFSLRKRWTSRPISSGERMTAAMIHPLLRHPEYTFPFPLPCPFPFPIEELAKATGKGEGKGGGETVLGGGVKAARSRTNSAGV